MSHRTPVLHSAALIVLLSATATLGATSPAAAAEPVFPVMNTSETPPDGVWFRRSPHTADTDQVTGHGVYKNERVQLRCYAWGEAVGPYSNRLWYEVLNVTRPTNAGVTNEGYLNAHYIDDGKNSNVVDDGVPECGRSAPPSHEQPAPPTAPPPDTSGGDGIGAGNEGAPKSASPPSREKSGPASVFYSGTDTPTGVPNIGAADLNLGYHQWTVGNCKADGAVAFQSDNAHTLAGWSKGRLGVVYFLSAAGAERINQVHKIILFDPGSTSDFTASAIWERVVGAEACDQKYDINLLLANWLQSNSANHLLVFTGKDSEEKEGGESKYRGLWKYYFAGIWNQPFADRAQVCDYDLMEHKDVLRNFAYIIKDDATSCPQGSNRTVWNP